MGTPRESVVQTQTVPSGRLTSRAARLCLAFGREDSTDAKNLPLQFGPHIAILFRIPLPCLSNLTKGLLELNAALAELSECSNITVYADGECSARCLVGVLC